MLTEELTEELILECHLNLIITNNLISIAWILTHKKGAINNNNLSSFNVVMNHQFINHKRNKEVCKVNNIQGIRQLILPLKCLKVNKTNFNPHIM